MKVLILSCNTGGGHNSCALAISKKLNEYAIDNKIVDALKFTSISKKAFIENGHTFMYRYAPKLYGATYTYTENMKNHEALFFDYAKYAGNIALYIKSNKYDVCICTHEFPAFMLTEARKLFKLKIKQYFVITDYSLTPGVEKTKMDAWFIPRGFKALYVKAKLKEDKMIETGIPVDEKFYSPISKEKARKLLGLRNDSKVFLIGAGSIGCGDIDELAIMLKNKYPNTTIAILFGNNKQLLKKLATKVDDGYLIPIGYTDKILEWLCAADIYITKAGGLSTTEAASLNVPMIFLDAVQGLERHNLDYYVNNGLGLIGDNNKTIFDSIDKLLNEKLLKDAMLVKQKTLFNKNAVKELVDYVIKDYGV